MADKELSPLRQLPWIQGLVWHTIGCTLAMGQHRGVAYRHKDAAPCYGRQTSLTSRHACESVSPGEFSVVEGPVRVLGLSLTDHGGHLSGEPDGRGIRKLGSDARCERHVCTKAVEAHLLVLVPLPHMH